MMSMQYVVKALSVILSIMLGSVASAEDDMRCGTQAAHEVFLSSEDLARPSNGPLYIYTPNFIIHYDTVGVHACSPAYAESTAVYAEYVREVQVGGLGFAPPPPDNAGPDDRYDIYIRYINPYYGQSWTEAPYPDPYPTGATSYVKLRNTMTWDELRACTAHEFNHGCQKRYSSQYLWWYENVACWAEEMCYDHVDWYVLSLNTYPNPLADPHLSIDNMDNEYEYASQIWPMFLHEYYGSSCLRLIWEEIGAVGGGNVLQATDSVLHRFDSDLDIALANYAVWRYFTGTRADTTNRFHESHLWPTSYVNPNHQHTGPGSGSQGSDYLDGPGGTSFIEFYTSPDYLLKNSLVGTPDAEYRVYSVGCDQAIGHRQYLMDCDEYWSVLPTVENDTTLLIPTVTSTWQNQAFDYFGESISLTPVPPQDPDLEITSILSPVGTVTPYSSIVPYATRCNNATTTTVPATWVSLYIGDWYGDSYEFGPINPGVTDTISFDEWTALERQELDVLCVGGGAYDVDVANNYCDGMVLVTLSDFEVMEILSPRGIVPEDVAVAPSVLIRNNGTSSNSVNVVFAVDGYSDMGSIYLEPDSSGELFFGNWMPTQLGACSTSCTITTTDQRPMNDMIIGEVYVSDETGIGEVGGLPPAALIHSPVPNPFTSSTTISFELVESGDVRLDVYDLSGRSIVTLVEGSRVTGTHSVPLDAVGMTSGVYLIRLVTSSQSITTRAVLMR